MKHVRYLKEAVDRGLLIFDNQDIQHLLDYIDKQNDTIIDKNLRMDKEVMQIALLKGRIGTLEAHLDRYRWIPVEERNPEKDTTSPAGWSIPCEVLTMENLIVSPAFYVDSEWVHFGNVIDNVIMFREIKELQSA